MSIFSYPFFALWAVCAVLYYTIAGKYQWLLLLGMSLVFYGYTAWIGENNERSIALHKSYNYKKQAQLKVTFLREGDS